VLRRIEPREVDTDPLQPSHPGLGVPADQGVGQGVEGDQGVVRVAPEGREARGDQEAEESGRKAGIVPRQLSRPGVPLATMTGTRGTTEAWDGKWDFGFGEILFCRQREIALTL